MTCLRPVQQLDFGFTYTNREKEKTSTVYFAKLLKAADRSR